MSVLPRTMPISGIAYCGWYHDVGLLNDDQQGERRDQPGRLAQTETIVLIQMPGKRRRIRWPAVIPAISVITAKITSTTYQRSTRNTHSSTRPISSSCNTVRTLASSKVPSIRNRNASEIAPLMTISTAASATCPALRST